MAFSCRRTPVWERTKPRGRLRVGWPQPPTRSHLVFYPGCDVEKPASIGASIGKADAVPIPTISHPLVSAYRTASRLSRHRGRVSVEWPRFPSGWLWLQIWQADRRAARLHASFVRSRTDDFVHVTDRRGRIACQGTP